MTDKVGQRAHHLHHDGSQSHKSVTGKHGAGKHLPAGMLGAIACQQLLRHAIQQEMDSRVTMTEALPSSCSASLMCAAALFSSRRFRSSLCAAFSGKPASQAQANKVSWQQSRHEPILTKVSRLP